MPTWYLAIQHIAFYFFFFHLLDSKLSLKDFHVCADLKEWLTKPLEFYLQEELRHSTEKEFILGKEASHKLCPKTMLQSQKQDFYLLIFLLTTAGGDSTGQTPLDSKENHRKTLRGISSGEVPAYSFSDGGTDDRLQCEQG